MGKESLILKQEEILNRLNVIRVDGLSEVSNYICPSEERAVIVDLDGVLCCRGRENNPLSNLMRLRGLLRTVDGADRVLFSTSRWEIGKRRVEIDNRDELISREDQKKRRKRPAVSHCPFLTQESKVFLEDLIRRKNPDCLVEFDSTPKKMIGKNEKTLQFAKTALDEGLDLAIVGSGYFDRKMAEKIVHENQSGPGRVNLFSLGYGLI